MPAVRFAVLEGPANLSGDSVIQNLQFGDSLKITDNLDVFPGFPFTSGGLGAFATAKNFISPAKAALTNQGLTYKAKTAGTGGNSTSIALTNPGSPSQSISAAAVGQAITVSLATDAGAAATKEIQDLTYTADDAGTDGNDITIIYIGDGVAGLETVDVVGTDITVHMDPTAVIGSTATQIKAAVDGEAPAAALVDVTITGTGSNVQTDFSPAQNLIGGGVGFAITSTADDVKAAIQGAPGPNALVDITGTGATPVTALTLTLLTGGSAGNVDATNNVLTITNHGFSTGLKVQLTTTGTLPAGLALLTDYFVIVLTANTIKLAASLDGAFAGDAVDITGTGSVDATHTATAANISDGTLKCKLAKLVPPSQRPSGKGNWFIGFVSGEDTDVADGSLIKNIQKLQDTTNTEGGKTYQWYSGQL